MAAGAECKWRGAPIYDRGKHNEHGPRSEVAEIRCHLRTCGTGTGPTAGGDWTNHALRCHTAIRVAAQPGGTTSNENPMRQVFNVRLMALQGALVLSGIVVVLITINTFAYEYRYFSAAQPATPGADSYTLPQHHRPSVGLSTVLCAVGLRAALFYLRRLDLAR